MHLIPLPALTDNYIWLIHDDHGDAIVVDPGDADVVEQALASHRLTLRAVLLTHHHPDHIDGAAALAANHSVPVHAPVDRRIPAATSPVIDGDTVDFSAPSISFQVIAVPGHTLTHVAFFGGGMLFCGDTLFSMGCGRLFEGTPRQMLDSLDRLCQLPRSTLICCGHEYTQANARFALSVDPDNQHLQGRWDEVAELRHAGRPTLPVALSVELATNPFLRVDAPAIAAWCDQRGIANDRVAHFAALREAKNGFQG